ncbi:hypothetical protein G6F62_006174 [Rhizopus arrhizus]|nr:hypothetical protein G6F62_006174 [Rhizopus arrhizus]
MCAPIFYHYYPSGEFVRDGPDDVGSEYQLKDNEGGATIKHAMEDLDLDGVPLPEMIWTPIKYKPSQVAQFISLIQNKNYKLAKAAKEAGIAYDAAYNIGEEQKRS